MKAMLPRTVSGAFHLIFLIVVVPLVMAIAAGGADRASVEAIHTAAEAGDIAAVTALLEEDAELLQARNAGGSTPLHTASEAGMMEIVELLVSHGAEVDAGDNENTTPLGVAAVGGHLNVIEFLISKGADPLAVDDNGHTALHWAAFNNHVDVAGILLDLGVDINAANSGGTTALHGAAFSGHTAMVEFLLSKGASLNLNQGGYTPLVLAAYRGKTDVVRVLIEQGADTSIWADWQSPLHMAARSGNPETVGLLLSEGADVNARLEDSPAPLIPAIESGSVEIVNLLLDSGADVRGGWDSGYTALHFAVQQGNCEIAEELIRRGAAVNAADEDGTSPLDVAVREGNTEIVGILIENGAKVNDRDKHYGRTPLHIAAADGNGDIVGVLLANGGGVNDEDREGYTALDLAARYGHKDVAELLAARGGKSDKKIENYGYCPLLGKQIDKGEALLWYTGHCGWAVKTRKHFLVFDYWKRGADPASPCLANGHINPAEISDLDVVVFVTHEHRDHFDTTIFDWERRIDSITYVFGFRPEDLPEYRRSGYHGPEYEYVGPRESTVIGDIKISTIRANDAGVGFLVEVDGVTLYHAGDHAGWAEGEKQGYIEEIDYLAGVSGEIDIAFLNVTGCHAHNPDALREGTYYTLERLKPRAVIPTHAGGREFVYGQAIERAAEDGIGAAYAYPRCRGDRFIYSGGVIRQDMRSTSS